MMDESTVSALADAFAALHGRACWSVLFGPATGRVVQLQFEERIRRIVPVENDALSEEERLYDAEFVLYVSCAWRLDELNAVICSSGDVERDALRAGRILERLVGKRVIATDVSDPAADVAVTLEDGYRLFIFCDEPTDYTNYSLLGPTATYSARAHGRVEVVRRRFDET